MEVPAGRAGGPPKSQRPKSRSDAGVLTRMFAVASERKRTTDSGHWVVVRGFNAGRLTFHSGERGGARILGDPGVQKRGDSNGGVQDGQAEGGRGQRLCAGGPPAARAGGRFRDGLKVRNQGDLPLRFNRFSPLLSAGTAPDCLPISMEAMPGNTAP